MTALTWDNPGEKTYQTGIDRGVLYLTDGTAVAWNGLTSVDEDSNSELKSYYLDGVKYLDTISPGDFSGKLKAFTYPEEFDQVNGIANVLPGLSYHSQPVKSFNLSYRTRIGNDLEGTDYGYRIHLLYNLVAIPDTTSFSSLKDQSEAISFGWSLTGTPSNLAGYRPTIHISIDSTETDPDILEALENVLYGTDMAPPHLPTIPEVAGIFGSGSSLLITDNGDGTWTATDLSDHYITMTDPTTFQIDNADAVFLDATTYTVSTTTP